MSYTPEDPFATPASTEPVRPPEQHLGTPAVMKWQMVYFVAMLLLYVAVAVAGVLLMFFADEVAQDPDFEMEQTEAMILGGIYAALGVGLSLLFVVGLFWRRGMGGWVFQLILIALGMTSCCTWPLTIPLLIFWIRDKDAIVSG